MRLVIAGSRTFTNYELLKKEADDLIGGHPEQQIVIVSGGAQGADTLAEKYAAERGFELEVHRADWNQYGRRAGMIRNTILVKNSDVVLAFWDGESHGTKNIIKQARGYGLTIKIVRF